MKKSMFRVLSIVLCFALLFGSAVGTSAANDAEISRVSCVVYGDGATGRGFTWYTADETECSIEISVLGIDVTSSLAVEYDCGEWEGNYMHKAYVTGLAAGTIYSYTITAGTATHSGVFSTDNGDDIVNFIVGGDVQASSLEAFEVGQKVMETAYKFFPVAEFYATLGDYTNDSTNEEWDLYSQTFGGINSVTTHVPITGNHDSDKGWFNSMFALDTSESVQTNNGVNYSFDYGNVHIAVVNTNDMLAISNAQLTWLRNDMNSTDADWKIVLMHKAPYSLGKDIKWPDACYLQEALTEVCDATNVDLVMSGHDHMYVRTKPLNDNKVVEQKDGTTYILGGATGAKRYEFRKFILDNYFSQDILATAVAQANGEYFANGNLDNLDETNKGGIFNTISVVGGALALNTYVVNDETLEIKQIDELTIVKAQGENKITFTGENVQKSNVIDTLASFADFAAYTLGTWVPMFLKTLPDLLKEYIATGTF